MLHVARSVFRWLLIALKNSHFPMTGPWRDKCRPPLNKSTCWACWVALTAIPRYYLVFSPLTCPCLPGELPRTSQLKCFAWVSLLHGGHSWKWQRPFKDKPHDDDDDDDDGDNDWVPVWLFVVVSYIKSSTEDAKQYTFSHYSGFLARDVYLHLALMLQCQCLSVCDGSALAH